MADIDWPKDLIPYKMMFYLQPHVGGQESPLTRTKKVYGLSAPRWIARLTFRAGHDYANAGASYRYGSGIAGPRGHDPAYYAARLDALIAQLKGGLVCARFHDFRRPRPQSPFSSYLPSPTVDAAPAGASTITINRQYGGIGPSIGDYIGGDGRPHIITAVDPMGGTMMSTASQAGKINLTFEPPLRTEIVDGADLEDHEVTARFRLTSEDAGQNESEPGSPVEYVLDFVEALE